MIETTEKTLALHGGEKAVRERLPHFLNEAAAPSAPRKRSTSFKRSAPAA